MTRVRHTASTTVTLRADRQIAAVHRRKDCAKFQSSAYPPTALMAGGKVVAARGMSAWSGPVTAPRLTELAPSS